MSPSSYKIVSLNLEGYFNWEAREGAIVNLLNESDADFVCLQEVRFDSDVSPLDEAQFINTKLARPYEYSASAVSRYYEPGVGKPYKEGLAVLSRYPIRTSDALALTKYSEDKHQRIILNVDVRTDDGIIKLSNVHFSNNIHSVQHLEETLGIFAARDEQRIVVGDFNIFDMRPNRALFEPTYRLSTDHAFYVSYPSKKETLDYILLPRAYRFEAIDTRDGLSDHAALIGSIELS